MPSKLKSMSKTALRRLAHEQNRSSPYKRLSAPTVPKGTRRAADPNDYGTKYEHANMYIRDSEEPNIHYSIEYSPQVEFYLLSQITLNAESPSRYSYIRTTTHPTHRILGNDVKSYHQLKDSGFRYQEKFPHSLRICLDGMGVSGSSNRPYVLSDADFVHHFATIDAAYRGEKKAKLCLYEQVSHKPRVEWLRELVKLVFDHQEDYDDLKYRQKKMYFDGTRLMPIEDGDDPRQYIVSTPVRVLKELSWPDEKIIKKEVEDDSLMCHEQLSSSSDEDEEKGETTDDDAASETDTVIHDEMNDIVPSMPMIEINQDSQNTVDFDEEDQSILSFNGTNTSSRVLSSPLVDRSQSITAIPLPPLILRSLSNQQRSVSRTVSNLFTPPSSVILPLAHTNSSDLMRLPSDLLGSNELTTPLTPHLPSHGMSFAGPLRGESNGFNWSSHITSSSSSLSPPQNHTRTESVSLDIFHLPIQSTPSCSGNLFLRMPSMTTSFIDEASR